VLEVEYITSKLVRTKVPVQFGKLSKRERYCEVLENRVIEADGWIREDYGAKKVRRIVLKIVKGEKGAGRVFEILSWTDKEGRRWELRRTIRK